MEKNCNNLLCRFKIKQVKNSRDLSPANNRMPILLNLPRRMRLGNQDTGRTRISPSRPQCEQTGSRPNSPS